jgi:hypothetical protein
LGDNLDWNRLYIFIFISILSGISIILPNLLKERLLNQDKHTVTVNYMETEEIKRI